jgi:tetratricopeptide (TPR) repeat protein/transcriptional regulator with XRE-family HTH domain
MAYQVVDRPGQQDPSGQVGFGLLLRSLRERALVSQEELAARAGVSVRAIGNLEQGRVAQPRGESVRLLADALGLVGPERQRFEDAARQRIEDPGRPRSEGLPGGSAGSWAASQRPAPCQLPPAVADFTGRTEQVTQLGRLLASTGNGRGGAVVVSAVAGQAGIGKSALAIHVAHQLRDWFPDGQLYVNLGGAQQQPLPAALVLGRFLRALGVDGAAIPPDGEEREALYRAWLADRRVLVVLDNAASEVQVRPLLPGTPGCGVLVTSRARLAGLEGARLLHLDVLEVPQALELLGRIVGAERVAAEPEAAAEIVGFCGQLPLAIRVAGARLATRPGWPLARLAELLADARRRLDQLAAGDLEVRASLALGYQALSGEQQRALRRLSLLEVGDFSAWLAAPLLGIGHDRAEALVEGLADAQLLELAAVDPAGASRFRFHDLVRLHAREQAAAEDGQEERRVAVAGVTAGWLALAEQADARLPVTAFVVSSGGAARWLFSRALVERLLADPLAWFELERANLLAAVELAAGAGLEEPAWELVGCMTSFLLLRSYLASLDAVQERALTACRQAGNRRGEAAILCARGGHLTEAGHSTISLTQGEAMLSRALVIFQDLDDERGQAKALHALSALERRVGRHRRPAALGLAVDHAQQALQLARAIGDLDSEADALIALGRVYQELARHQEAAAVLEVARGLVEQLGARRDLAIVIFHLGVQARDTGRPGEAIALLNQSLAIARELDDWRGQAQLLLELGKLHSEQGRLEDAEVLLGAATELWPPQVQGPGFRAMALDELGRLRTRQGRFDQAIGHLTEAAGLWQQLGAPASQARTLIVLGDALATAGHPRQADTARQQARALQPHDPGDRHPG